MEAKKSVLKAGNWETIISNNSLTFPKAAKEEALEFIYDYVEYFPKEDVFVQNKFGIPSLILSMNCTFKNNLNVYSVSQNPKNLGIAVKVNTELKRMLEKAKSTWPEVKATFHPHFQDDGFWIDIINPEEVGKMSSTNKDLILIRSSQFQRENEYLKNKSASSIIKRNCNSYGEDLRLWSIIRFGQTEKAPWDKGFALKPLSKIISSFNLYYPRSYGGLITEKKAETLISNRSFYLQKFIHPMESVIKGEKMIYKIFFAFDTEKKEYAYLGGLWLSRDNYRIHGTPETTFGKLV